jgi:hypothetical protein
LTTETKKPNFWTFETATVFQMKKKLGSGGRAKEFCARLCSHVLDARKTSTKVFD